MKHSPLLMVWKIGRDSLDELPKDAIRYRHSLRTLRAEIARLKAKFGDDLPVKLGVDSVPKLRRIATEYTLAEIRTLARRVRESGSTFGPTHLIRLLGIRNTRQRLHLLERAISHNWSVKRLVVEIQCTRGTRRSYVGRKPSIPRTRGASLEALHREVLSWRRWTAAASMRLPAAILESVKAVDGPMLALVEKIEAYRKRPGYFDRTGPAKRRQQCD